MFNDAIPEGTGSSEPGLRQMNDATEGIVRANNISLRFFFYYNLYTYQYAHIQIRIRVIIIVCRIRPASK